MNEASLLEVLRTSSEVKRILERDFDFQLFPPTTESGLFHFSDGTAFELIAGDGGGGEFVLCDGRGSPTRPLLFVSSDGQKGIIARNLERGIATIIDLPYWYDCLHFSGGGQLAEMRRVVPLSEEDLVAHKPNIMSSRDTLRTQLRISRISDPVQELHAAITELSTLYTVCAPDGWEFEPLFGKFTVRSNGDWRRRLKL
jgi:hypothetical protein